MAKENKNQIFSRVEPTKQEIVSITYEEIGFFPRSFSRVLDRFLKQVFSDVENLVIQEYRFYRYLFLTTLKCLLMLFFVPFLVNFFAKTYLVRPFAEYFWNTQQTEIFLNSYQQKRAFSELKNFEEKLYFESLIIPASSSSSSSSPWHLSLPFTTKGPLFSTKKAHFLKKKMVSGYDQRVKTAAIGTKKKWKNKAIFFIKKKLDKASLLLGLSPEGPLDRSPFSKEFKEKGGERPRGPLVVKGNENKERTEESVQVSSTDHLVSVFPPQDPLVSFSPEKTNLKDKDQREFQNGFASPYPDGQGPKGNQFRNKTLDLDKVRKENSKRDAFEQRLQEKTIELAIRYNNKSIEAVTNFFADLLSFITLCYLLFALEIQINITKSFLLEVFFGLDDSKKSLLILLVTDLLVGYHSSNLWELFFEFLFNHYGLPESQTGIFLLVATLPVLLDVLFKYLIFRHLNRSSPATVATYHAMIE